MPGEKLTVGAIGVGPVGTILATCLAEAGAEICVADVPPRIDQIKQSGLQIHWDGRDYRHAVSKTGPIGSLAEWEPDIIFISTKACLLKKIMPQVAQVASDRSLVLSIQNGIGTEDKIAEHVPRENVGRMVVNYAGGIDENGIVNVNCFNPPNFFGLLTDHEDPRLFIFIEMLNTSGLTSELVDPLTIKKKAFLKTILNSALMPVCAIMGITMSEAMQGRLTRRLAEDLLTEGFSVAERMGYFYGDDIREKCLGYLNKGGNHHPSMSIDLKCKRPTEIDFINGKILNIGASFGDLDLPVNRTLVSLVMTQEVRNGTREPDDFPDHLFGY
ncbi:MAG: ketopantoate reductase family protein [bacterium]